MSYFKLPPRLKFKLHSMPRGRNLPPVSYHCNLPHKSLTVDFEGDCFVCICDGWLPITVGKIEEFNSLSEIWTSPVASLLQKDVESQKFTWCAVNHCGVKNSSIHSERYELLINTDNSCNLACPSCRSGPIMLTQGSEFDLRLARTHKIISMLEQFTQPIHVTMTGNGDPLASLILRPLILNYIPKATQTFKLFTNGLLLKKLLPKSKMIDQITEYSISIDAGSADVYADVRRPGKWDNLLENLEFLKTVVDRTQASVTLNFVFQKNNYKDLGNFLDLCHRFDYDPCVSPLTDWGTWNNFNQHNVLDASHPDHLDALQELSKYSDRQPKWATPGLLKHLDER